MRVTVTGATGFIGSHLLDRLLTDDHRVTALVRRPQDLPLLEQRGVATVIGDISDQASLERAMIGSQVVLHLVRAKSHGSRPREVFEVNVEGTRNVARAAVRAGVERVVHCSSVAVYGTRAGKVNEQAVLHPDSAYARSKVQAEAVLREELGGNVESVIARITAVLGPRCKSWLSLFRSAASGELRVAGDGSNMHHPADVADIVDGLIRCAFTPAAAGRVYNLAGPRPLPISELRQIMAEAVKPGSEPRFPRPYPRRLLDLYYHSGRMTDRFFGVRLPLFESVSFITADRVLDISRAREELGYNPQISASEGARRTALWYYGEGSLAGSSGT